MNTKVEHYYMRALLLRFHSALSLQKWALVIQGKMASPHDHNPKYLNF